MGYNVHSRDTWSTVESVDDEHTPPCVRMMERLSARLSLKSSKIAIQAGITRLESRADESTKVGIALTSELIQLAIKKGRRVVFT